MGSQKDNFEKLSQAVNSYNNANRNLWTHLTIIEATILGLSLPLVLTTHSEINWWMVLAWTCQLLVVGLGLFLIKQDADREFWTSFDNFRFAYDMAEFENTTFANDEEKEGVLISILFEKNKSLGKSGDAIHWTKLTQDLNKKYSSKRPSAKYFNENPSGKESCFFKLYLNYAKLLTSFFYSATFLSFLCFLIGAIYHITKK